MKILFISQYFYPENFKGNDLVFGLTERGHEITVVTGIPNYPKGDFFDGYHWFKRNQEIMKGVKIIRLPLIPRKTGTPIWLILNYVSFFISQFIFFKFGKINNDFDIVITQQLSPLTSSLSAVWYKKKFNIPLITWVLDLWPESVIVNSNLKKGLIINYLNKLVRYLYNESDCLLVSSNSFKNSIEEKVGKKEVIFFPNWAEEVYTRPISTKFNFQKLPDGFNIVFAGNLGETQDFESLVKCINELKNQDFIKWNFVGDGRYKTRLEKLVKEFDLKNIFLYPNHSVEYMPSLFCQADVMLLTLKGGESLVSHTIPGKLQAYMACGKLIVGMIDGEANMIIQNSSCGFVVNSGDYIGLSKIIKKASKLSKDEKAFYEHNSLNYYNNNFSRELLLNKIETILVNLK